MSLDQFQTQLKEILRHSGHTQQQLAAELGMHPTVLSNKLHGVRKGRLTNPEVKQIIKTLAGWEAIFTRQEVAQLLDHMDLTLSVFRSSDWDSLPLNWLTAKLPSQVAVPAPTISPGSELELASERKSEINTQLKPGRQEHNNGSNNPPEAKRRIVFSSVEEGRARPLSEKVQKVEPNRKFLYPHIPQALTRLIGREEVLEDIEKLISQDDVRLVNLVGPGGIGKTRVALAIAQRLLDLNRFKNGVYFIGLDNLNNPALVVKTICNNLKLPERKDNSNPLDQLIEFLAGKEVLLVLDNFEQLLDATSALAHLLTKLPGLKLLVTSRIILGIYGEWEYTVPPLPLPPPLPLSRLQASQNGLSSNRPDLTEKTLKANDIATILESPAVALFVERAQAINYRFNLNEQSIDIVVRVCRLLDGVPLALELAAARTRLFDLPQLEELLHRSYLAVLNSVGQRVQMRSERHQSLQVCLEWSYSLLSKEERTLFCRLALFADTFSLETAQAVTPASLGITLLASRLESLIGQSLLQPEEPPISSETPDQPELELKKARRYRMLEPLREFGLEQLKLGNSASSFVVLDDQNNRSSHLQEPYQIPRESVEPPFEIPRETRGYFEIWHDYCLYWSDWVKKLVAELYGPNVQPGFMRMQQEYANILSALEWGLQHNSYKAVLALAAELAFYWIWGTQYNVGTQYLDRVIALTGNLPDLDENGLSLRGKVLYGSGFIAVNQLDFLKAESLLQESLTIFRNQGDKVWLVRVLGGLAFRATSQGQFHLSRRYLDEGLALSREIGDEGRLAASLNNLSVVAIHLKEDAAALAYSKECLSLVRKQQNKVGQAMSLNLLGYITVNHAEFELAQKYLEESLEIARSIGYRESLSLTQNVYALNYYTQDNFKLARYHLNEGLRIANELGDRFSILYNLSAQSMISLKLATGRTLPDGTAESVSGETAKIPPYSNYDTYQRAARLLGATAALTKQTNGFAFPRFRELFEEGIKAVQEKLTSETFELAWQLGEQMSLEEAVEYALKD